MSTSQATPYLQSFTKLGSQIYLREPTDHVNSSTNIRHDAERMSSSSTHISPPDLLILCTWMGAAARHIDKYTKAYISRFPSTSILLLRSEVSDIALRSVSQQVKRMGPAAVAVKNFIDQRKSTGQQYKILLHTFSNGGSWTACVLADAYENLYDDFLSKLPVSAVVIDSAPSLPNARIFHNAVMQALRKSIIIRIVGGYILWIFIAVTWLLGMIGMRQNVLLKMRATFNDFAGPFLSYNIPRLYICSRTDKMVPIEEVIAHASEARIVLRKNGVQDIEDMINFEEFIGSAHVGHMMADGHRYWRLIDDTWDKTKMQN
jgi:hypothetical protein